MPSEEARKAAFRSVAVRAEAFSAALAITADQLGGYLDANRRSADGAVGAAASLGPFAAGRIDVKRFAAFSSPDGVAGQSWIDAATAALAVLTDLRDREDALFHLRLPAGADLARAVDDALAEAGRAFAAARLVAQSPHEEDGGGRQHGVLERFPFRQWSQSERAVAPPLVIEAEGCDLSAAGLASYLDGAQCFVLVAAGPAPAAPLGRLLSPGVFSLQTSDPGGLQLPPGWRGPAVMALLPENAAQFLHIPSGRGLSGLDISHLPDAVPGRPLGPISAFQQAEDLAILRLLGAPQWDAGPAESSDSQAQPADSRPQAEEEAKVPESEPAADPVDALASWLLANADLEGI